MDANTLNKKVQDALSEIRPFLESDGGNIELVSITNDVVKVKLLGNCVNCSVNQMTLKNGVEMTIKKHAPEIKEVINIS
jgi:Fe-S cluster biogenesis protein NfuA|tara:strand:- start:84 stop:320 length:237 start_codon:yes stop_codon:yes gene_type:complete